LYRRVVINVRPLCVNFAGASFSVTNSWTGQFRAGVTVHAGSSPVNSWTLNRRDGGSQPAVWPRPAAYPRRL